MSVPLALIVGLGNPGADYARTRHNAGADFVAAVASAHAASLRLEARFHGLTARVAIGGEDVRLLFPQTWMNLSGKAVAAMATFFKLAPEQILVAYDELDLPVGEARFKHGGGHGGHNGLRDIVPALANNAEFYRLRIGIGHPGHRDRVTGHVLSRPGTDDRVRIDRCIDEALNALPDAVAGRWPLAMNRLNSFKVD